MKKIVIVDQTEVTSSSYPKRIYYVKDEHGKWRKADKIVKLLDKDFFKKENKVKPGWQIKKKRLNTK